MVVLIDVGKYIGNLRKDLTNLKAQINENREKSRKKAFEELEKLTVSSTGKIWR